MRAMCFSNRVAKEILRDPLNLMFGLGFPIVLLILLRVISSNIPVDLFSIETLTPGITVFGLSFMTLFSATLVAKDRESAFLKRLYTTPLTAVDFILGYTLPLLPIAILQCLICYFVALFLGLPLSVHILYATLALIPMAIFFIALGLLCGSFLTSKQVGGVCRALLTNLTAWFSGVWFDLELVGGTFSKIAHALPFVHAVELEKAILSGQYAVINGHLYEVLAYAMGAALLAIFFFLRQMRR